MADEKKQAQTVFIVIHYPLKRREKQILAVFDAKEKAVTWMDENEASYGGLRGEDHGFGLELETHVVNFTPEPPEEVEIFDEAYYR